MGLLSKLLFFPVAGPVATIQWSLGKVQHVVEEELTDDTPIKQDLMELQMRLELSSMSRMRMPGWRPTNRGNSSGSHFSVRNGGAAIDSEP